MEQRKRSDNYLLYAKRTVIFSLFFISCLLSYSNNINAQGSTHPKGIDSGAGPMRHKISTRIKLNRITLEEISPPSEPDIDFISTYKYRKYKLAIGNYKPTKDGGLSIYDSESDYGLRLFLYDEIDNLLFKSPGAYDMWQLFPAFFELRENKGLIIFLEAEDEGEFSWIQVVMMNGNQIKKLGNIEHLAYNKFESIPSRDVIDVYDTMNNTFEFIFTTDYVWEVDSKTYEYKKLKAQDIKYIYNGEKIILRRY